MSHVSKISVVEEDNGGELHPEGMHILVIESNHVSLTVIVGVLKLCKYAVTATTIADEALKILRNNHNEIDIVITNVMRSDMSGFELLEIISRETDLPVIIVSADDSNSTVMKGIRHGAKAYLSKPVRKSEIQNIFQHVIRKKLSSIEKSSITRQIMERKAMPLNKPKEKINDEDDEANTVSGGARPSNQKKPRLTWTRELHSKFVDAIHHLEAVNKVHPKLILENMNVEGLTREKVASHLQKYRKCLKKNKESMSQEASGAIDSYTHGGNSLSGISCDKRITKSGDNNVVDLIPNPNILSNYSMDMNSAFLNPSHQNMFQHRAQSSSIANKIQQGMNNLPVQELGGYNFPTFYSSMNMADKYMAITSQSLGYNYHSNPGPSSVPFNSNPSAACPNQLPWMLGLTSTDIGATSQHAYVVLPSQNILPGQHDGGHSFGLNTGANSNYRGLTTDYVNNRQHPSMTGMIRNDETQFLQQSSELSNIEKNFLSSNGNFTEYDLSVLLQQFSDDCPPRL